MRYPKTTAALATAGALSLGAVPVIAQQGTDDPAATAEESVSPDSESNDDQSPDESSAERERPAHRAPFGRFGGMVDHLSDDFAEELAAELGIDAGEVADAIDRVRDRWMEDLEATFEEHRAEAGEKAREHLDRAVEEGVLSPEQADALADLFAGDDVVGPGMIDDLTDEQREALETLRDWAVEQFDGMEWRNGHGPRLPFGPGGPDPDEWFDGEGHPDENGGEADPFEDESSDDATTQESSLQTT